MLRLVGVNPITRATRERLVGRRGHYLNSRIELGDGVLDLIRTHCGRLEQPGAGALPPLSRPA